jgi:hypothetical protein
MDDVQVNRLFDAVQRKAEREMGSVQSTCVAYQLGLLRGMIREHLVDGVSWDELMDRVRGREVEHA